MVHATSTGCYHGDSQIEREREREDRPNLIHNFSIQVTQKCGVSIKMPFLQHYVGCWLYSCYQKKQLIKGSSSFVSLYKPIRCCDEGNRNDGRIPLVTGVIHKPRKLTF